MAYDHGTFNGEFSTLISGFALFTLPGTEFIDTVTIAPGLVIPRQSIGVASESFGFDGFDGVLGLACTSS
jgi:hypothetical protein